MAPNLTVHQGGRKPPGGGGGGSPPASGGKKAPDEPENFLTRVALHLPDILPAPSHAEISRRLTKALKEDISLQVVKNVLDHVRGDPDYFGWTVFYAGYGSNQLKLDQYVVVWRARDGSYHSDADEAACLAGFICAVKNIRTRSVRASSMAQYQAVNTQSRTKSRNLRRRAEDLQFTYRKMEELLEDLIDEANGA